MFPNVINYLESIGESLDSSLSKIRALRINSAFEFNWIKSLKAEEAIRMLTNANPLIPTVIYEYRAYMII